MCCCDAIGWDGDICRLLWGVSELIGPFHPHSSWHIMVHLRHLLWALRFPGMRIGSRGCDPHAT